MFGKCNHAKKLFRVEHFKQHLKHSHVGIIGEWTVELENACMKDEPLPLPVRDCGTSSVAEQFGTQNEVILEEQGKCC